MNRLAAAILGAGLAASLAFAQGGTTPKTGPSDYPAHASSDKAAFGAEYLVRSISGGNQTFIVPDYLVVEVAVFPTAKRFPVRADSFTLKVNGKKQELLSQTPAFVAASLKYPDWEMRPRLESAVGLGDSGIIIGRPTPVERFPGDQRPRQSRLPDPPRAPAPENRSGIEKEPPVRADELAVAAALPEGEAAGPVSGFIYFPFRSKPKSIRSLDLVYRDRSGKPTTLRLLSTR